MYRYRLGVLFTVASLLSYGCSTDKGQETAEALRRGNAYAARQKYSEAIIEYRRAIQADGKSGEARKQLANAYLETGDFPNALRESVRAADLLPNDVDAQIRAGNLLLAAGKFEDARTRAEQALGHAPQSADAHMLRGNALAGLRDLDAALTDFEEAAAAAPQNGLIHANIGAMHMARGAQADAEAAFRTATELSPSSALARVAYANFLLATERSDAAEAELKQAATAAPNDPTVRRALAALYVSTNRTAEAEPHLRKLADISSDPKARFALARYYFAISRRDEAFRELGVLASQKESYVDATLQTAAARYAEGQTVEGRRLLAEVLTQFPTNPRANLVKATFLASERKWADAIAAARAATERDPRLLEAFYVLGVAHQGNRDFEAAKQAFSEVLRLEPNATRAQVALADLHLLMRDVDTAGQLASEAANRAPRVPEVRATLVRTLMANGDFAAAEKAISAFKTDFPDRQDPYVLDGTLRFMRKDYGAAERAFSRAAEIDPLSVPAASGRVQVMLATGRAIEAKQFVERLTVFNGNNADYPILAARTYSTLRDFAPAERLLRKALELDPSRTETYSLLAQLYMLQNKTDDALREYESLAAREARSIPAHTMVGTILQIKNRRVEAKSAYRTALAIDSSSPVAANNLAWMMAEDGEDLDVALQLAQTAKAGLPDAADAADTLGWIYLKKGLTTQAVSEFREAASKQPDKAAFKYRLGLAYAEHGELGEARRTLEAALALDPKAPQAADARAALARLSRLGS